MKRRLRARVLTFCVATWTLARRVATWSGRRWNWTFIVALASLLVGLASFLITYREAQQRVAIQARRPLFSITLGSPLPADDGIDWQRLMVRNDGEGSGDTIDWHLLTPKDVLVEGISGNPGADVTVDGIVYTHRWLFLNVAPLHRRAEPIHFTSLRVDPKMVGAPQKFTLLWYIESKQFGTFPGLKKDGTPAYGRIEIPGRR